MSDEDEQLNEILILRSIYSENHVICNENQKPLEGKIYLEIDVCQLAKQKVEYLKTHAKDQESEEKIVSGYNFVEVSPPNKERIVHLKYLPPICFSFYLPPNYPSMSPPSFSIHSFWLSSEQINELSKKLKEIWSSNPHIVILFSWLDYLQNNLVSFLHIPQPLILSQEKILKLTEYDLKREESEFERSMQECSVCFSERVGRKCTRFFECGHVFCNECISGYLNLMIKEGQVTKLKCLADKCSTDIPPFIVKKLVSSETFERYDRLLLQNSLDSMNDIQYCPRVSCGCPCIIDRKNSMASCPKCSFVFCIYCKKVYHGVEKCKFKSEEMKKLYESYTTGNQETKRELEKIYGLKNLKELVDNFETESWLSSNSKKCPKCSTHIEKIDGCNKMSCTKCHTYFCWLCGQELKGSNPYLHFANKQSPCYNQLFLGLVDEEPQQEDIFVEFNNFNDDEELLMPFVNQ